MSSTSVLLPEPLTPVTQVNVPSGIRDIDVLQIVFARADTSSQPRSGDGLIRFCGTGMDSSPVRYWPVRERGLASTSSSVPAATTSPPRTPAPGPEIEDVIGAANGVFVVLDDEHGVAEVAQAFECARRALVVALVQADARLVEDIEHADEAGADLGGQPDALRFAAAQRAALPIEREILQPDVVRKPSRARISWIISAAIFCWKFGELEIGEKFIRLFDGQARKRP